MHFLTTNVISFKSLSCFSLWLVQKQNQDMVAWNFGFQSWVVKCRRERARKTLADINDRKEIQQDITKINNISSVCERVNDCIVSDEAAAVNDITSKPLSFKWVGVIRDKVLKLFRRGTYLLYHGHNFSSNHHGASNIDF